MVQNKSHDMFHIHCYTENSKAIYSCMIPHMGDFQLFCLVRPRTHWETYHQTTGTGKKYI